MYDIHTVFNTNKFWKKKQDEWKIPLEKKRLRREKRLANPIEPTAPEESKLVVHNIDNGIEYPFNPNQVFAVINMKGIQHKVAKDDRVILEWLPEFEVGQPIAIEDVLLVGTKDFTSIGRPTVANARVMATVEEHSKSQKVIIFKKKRRKGY